MPTLGVLVTRKPCTGSPDAGVHIFPLHMGCRIFGSSSHFRGKEISVRDSLRDVEVLPKALVSAQRCCSNKCGAGSQLWKLAPSAGSGSQRATRETRATRQTKARTERRATRGTTATRGTRATVRVSASTKRQWNLSAGSASGREIYR